MTLRRLVLILLAVLLPTAVALQAAPKAPPKPTAQELAQLEKKTMELLEAGKYRDAEPLLKRLIQVNPRNYVAWYNLACTYSRLGDSKRAVAALAMSIKLGWRDLEHMLKDEDLAALRTTREFQALVRALRQLEPGKTPAGPTTGPTTRPTSRPAGIPRPPMAEPPQLSKDRLREVGLLRRQVARLFDQKEYDKARDVLHKLLEIQPDSDNNWYNLACAHARMNNMPEAIACLTVAIEKGYAGFRHMDRDPDLKALRWTKAYQDLYARKDEIQRQRGEKILATLKAKYGADYICEIDHDRKMVFATNTDRQTLEDLKKNLTSYASAQWRDLFTHPFEQYITIIVPKQWPKSRVGGYYNHQARVLVCKSVGMVLTHEFTHALHFADQEGLGQKHPIWIVEGFSTLFETSTLERGRAVPQPNHRLNSLQAYLKKGQTIPFREFVKLSHRDFMRKASLAYSQTRYMMTYVYQKGLLKKFYDAYTEGYDEDPTGAKALAKVFGKDLADVEADWKKWVLAQKPLLTRLPAKHAYIGISMESISDGLVVRTVVPGSGADKAGIKVGDVITRIDGKRLVDPMDLIGVVGAHKVGDKLNVEFRRNGAYKKVSVTLQAMPAKLAAPPTTRPAPKKPAPKKPTPKAEPKKAEPKKPTPKPEPKKPEPKKPAKPERKKPEPKKPAKPEPKKPEPKKPAPRPKHRPGKPNVKKLAPNPAPEPSAPPRK